MPWRTEETTLPGKRKRDPLIMLTGLFASGTSSSNYAPLSDLENSSESPAHGMLLHSPEPEPELLLALSVRPSLLSVLQGLLTGSTLRGAIAAVCGTAFLVGITLSFFFCVLGAYGRVLYLYVNHDIRLTFHDHWDSMAFFQYTSEARGLS